MKLQHEPNYTIRIIIYDPEMDMNPFQFLVFVSSAPPLYGWGLCLYLAQFIYLFIIYSTPPIINYKFKVHRGVHSTINCQVAIIVRRCKERA